MTSSNTPCEQQAWCGAGLCGACYNRPDSAGKVHRIAAADIHTQMAFANRRSLIPSSPEVPYVPHGQQHGLSKSVVTRRSRRRLKQIAGGGVTCLRRPGYTAMPSRKATDLMCSYRSFGVERPKHISLIA